MKGLRRSALVVIAALLVLGFVDLVTTAGAQTPDKGRGRNKASPAPPDERGARVDEAMRVSGIRSHLALVRIRMKQILDEDPRVDYDARRWLAQTLDAAFSPEAFAKPIRQALLDGYDVDSLARVVAWYRSATGRKVVRLEQAATEPGIAQARKAYLASLENKQPSDYRLVLIFSLDEASRASEGTFAAEKAAVNGWNRGIEQILSGEERQQVAQTQVALDVFRAQIRDMVTDDVLREMLYTYREASDVELRAYVEFLESDAGKWFFRTVYQGQQAVVEKAVDKVADDFVATVLTKKITRPPTPPAQPTRR
jgi:Uncharacterized protein conserved in bacteria (DUF2059)